MKIHMNFCYKSPCKSNRFPSPFRDITYKTRISSEIIFHLQSIFVNFQNLNIISCPFKYKNIRTLHSFPIIEIDSLSGNFYVTFSGAVHVTRKLSPITRTNSPVPWQFELSVFYCSLVYWNVSLTLKLRR